MAISFLKILFEPRNLQNIICISIDLTKQLQQFSRPSGPSMCGNLFLRQIFLKNCLNLAAFGTYGTSYLSLSILLKSWNKSSYLRDLRDFICMAIYFFKKLFGSPDLRDLRDLISISIDLTKKLQ